MNLEQLLSYLEEHLDVDHCEDVEKRHVQAMDFQPTARPPISVNIPVDERVNPFPYQEAFSDFDKMLYNELTAISSNVLNSVETRDDFPLQIRPNFGIGVISSILGAEVRLLEGSMPWVQHRTLEEVQESIAKGIPDLDTGLGQKVRQCCEHFRERLAPYPKLSKYIHITQPDLQGPFDILHLLLGSDVFYHLMDEPEICHEILDLATDTYIAYRKFIEPYIMDKADGGKKCYVHFGMYGGSVVIKDDTATATVSQDMYEEFALPYNKRIYDAFGTASLHYCGKQKSWHYESMIKQNINCLNFGNSERHDWKGSFPILAEKKICVVDVGEDQPYSFCKSLMDQNLIPTGVTLRTYAGSRQEAVEILKQHREG